MSKHTFYVQYLFSENQPVYEIMGEKYGGAREATDDNIIWCMRFLCWIKKATDTRSKYLILTAFPYQQ
jgi:hypothetical protein